MSKTIINFGLSILIAISAAQDAIGEEKKLPKVSDFKSSRCFYPIEPSNPKISDNRPQPLPSSIHKHYQSRIDNMMDSRESIRALWKAAVQYNSDIQIELRKKLFSPSKAANSEIQT